MVRRRPGIRQPAQPLLARANLPTFKSHHKHSRFRKLASAPLAHQSEGELELSLQRVATPESAADEVVLRVEATPINSSATDATLCFDATGGGRLAGQILGAMEAALNLTAKEYSRYGSTTLKQVYIDGGLDTGPTEFARNFGMSWAMGGWLLFPFLQRIGVDAAQVLRQRVATELKTTFASRYTQVVSLVGALQLEVIADYGRRATASKVLIDPSV